MCVAEFMFNSVAFIEVEIVRLHSTMGSILIKDCDASTLISIDILLFLVTSNFDSSFNLYIVMFYVSWCG